MTRSADVAVVGAGPAGIGASLAAAENGASVILIDENDAPGGHLRWTMSHQSGFGGELEGRRGVDIARWSATALGAAGVDLRVRTAVWGVFEDNLLGVASETASFDLRAGSIILATGSTDAVWPFPGWELPGVMTATAALRMMHRDRVLPGRRVVVIGTGPLARAVATDLDACGGQIVLQTASTDGVTAGGDGVVEWIGAGGNRSSCDTVVIALGRQPDFQLAMQAQAAISYSQSDGVFVPLRDESLMTSLPGVYVVGDAGGVRSPSRAYLEGAVAGAAVSGGARLGEAIDRLRSTGAQVDPRPSMSPVDDATVVCRCEGIRSGEIRAAISGGATSMNDVKRRTRAGMGICQGIYCRTTVSRMISQEASMPIESIVPMTARPPARLISMAAMADFDG